MLLGPECFEQVGYPAVDRAKPVEPRVAGPAEGDQRRGSVGGSAVVDDERRGGPADAAEVMIASQHPFPAPAEAGPRSPSAVVAGLAQAAAVEIWRSAGTAERELLLMVSGHRASSGFSQAPSGRCPVWAKRGNVGVIMSPAAGGAVLQPNERT